MNFKERALPLIERGIKVIPVTPFSKGGDQNLINQFAYATLDPQQIECWNTQNPNFNVGCVASPDGIVILDCDAEDLPLRITQDTGENLPRTLWVTSAGKQLPHIYFRQTDKTRALGNRHSRGLFDWQSVNKYVVGPGSVLGLNGTARRYEIRYDHPIAACPDWLCDWILKNSEPEKPKAPQHSVPLDEDFDFDDFCSFFNLAISFVKDQVWYVLDACPGVGYRHEHSTLTAFYYDGETLGWSCFASSCSLSGMRIGEVVKFLNAQKGQAYLGPIWSPNVDLNDPMWGIEEADVLPAHEIEHHHVRSQPDDPEMIALFAELNPAPLPPPKQLEITPTVTIGGLEFPGQSCMYGKLGAIAERYPRLQLGWLYPSLLAAASALWMEDADHNVHANMYVCNIGDVGFGKSACTEVATQQFFYPPETLIEETPSSDRGLVNMLGEDAFRPYLLYSDEFREVLGKCSIRGSTLAELICKLWSKTSAGVSDKKSRQKAYGRLSILGNLKCNDPAEFAKWFGSASVAGMSDRFLFGFSTSYVKFQPTAVKQEVIRDIKPVKIPLWVWNAKDEWASDIAERRRLTEHVLRVALVTAAVNGDREITGDCLEASFRFMEWQERLRAVYRPGLAETKEAECFEAVYSALWEQLNKQLNGEKRPPKGTDSITSNQQEQARLLHWAQVVNAKSYYRKYSSTLINRVRQSMLAEKLIEAVKREEDGQEKDTPFVRLKGRIQ